MGKNAFSEFNDVDCLGRGDGLGEDEVLIVGKVMAIY